MRVSSGLHTTCQFNTKIYSLDGSSPHLWHSDPLNNHLFDPDMYSFGADNLALTLNEAGDAYTIKSAVNENSLVNLTFTRKAPGVVIGENGTSYFGTDPANPWGSMSHAFWPRCAVEGTITTNEKTYDLKGLGFYSFALQGMKPHHAGMSKIPFVFPSSCNLISFRYILQLPAGISSISKDRRIQLG